MSKGKIDWKKIRNDEKVKYPECQKGILITPFNPQISHFFKCNECGMKINID